MNAQPDALLASLPGLPLWHAALAIGPALASAAAALFTTVGSATERAWRIALMATLAALSCAAASLAAVLLGSHGAGFGVRADAAGAAMALLVTFVGWVIVRYSRTYLGGERGQREYVRWLMATLSAVALVVATNHVLVLAGAWTATSLALHHLLTFFGERPAAVVAAHKKFIVARAADACMLAAVALLYQAFGTLHLDEIVQRAAAGPLPSAAQAAAVLIAGAALLKCAQLPFHGWLIQVMEAPTPVSALLHAGVVNLGGFVLIRVAPLIAQAPAAQSLLVVAGTLTAVIAALVMTTRISIKVMLAWSTCAQMGFMLMQCGLGAWEMALLHLLAHSLYKAHAFLAAGGAVRRAQQAQLAPAARAPGVGMLAAGALLATCMTLAAGTTAAALLPGPALPPSLWVLAGIVALALVPLVHGPSLRGGCRWAAALAAGAFGVALAYFTLHAVLQAWLQPPSATPAAALWVGVAVAFAALFLLQSAIAVAPHGAVARALYPWFYGGLFLDETFNRIAFALWRPPSPAPAVAPLPPGETAPPRHASTTLPAGARA